MSGNEPHQDATGDKSMLGAITEFLSDPGSYPEKTATPEIRDTHLSRVFLTDTRVYKLKKPLRYDFLDFTSREARRRNCQTEVAINSELAPEVYLGVVTLAREEQAGFNLEGRGRPVDYLVKMVRMPDRQNLEHQISENTVDGDHIDRAAARLAHFYRTRADQGPVRASGFEKKIRRYADELRNLPVAAGNDLPRLEQGLLALLQEHRLEVENRRQVDAHGDLRPEHVYPGPSPVFLDRLEFDASLRLMDPLEELSFFAMECRRLGHDWIGQRFFDIHQQVTGVHATGNLIALYTGYRALLWAVLKARHLERNDQRKPWDRLAREYLQLGLEALDRAD
ncbi:MAG: hypothetical protein ACOCVV_09020 [Marinobacter sp.]